MSDQSEEYLRRLRVADEALYRLWQVCEIHGPLMKALNDFQRDFIQAEIERVLAKVNPLMVAVEEP